MYENLLANVPTDLWIGGKWRKSSDNVRFDVIDPATERKIASVASASVDDAKAAIDAADAAFEGWAGRKPRERAEILRKSYELIMRDAERFAKLITLENGKALPDSRGEVAHAAAQDRPGARRRLPGGAQARFRYPTHHAGADAGAGRGGRARRRGQRGALAPLRSGGERHAARSARAGRFVYRLDRGWPQAAARGRRQRAQAVDGARRQCAVPGVRGRRYRCRHRRRDERQDPRHRS